MSVNLVVVPAFKQDFFSGLCCWLPRPSLAPYSDVNKSDCDFSCLAEGVTVGEFIAELPEEFTAKAPPVPIV